MSKKYIKFYPVKTLIKWWRKRDITTEELKSLVKPEYLPKEVRVSDERIDS